MSDLTAFVTMFISGVTAGVLADYSHPYVCGLFSGIAICALANFVIVMEKRYKS